MNAFKQGWDTYVDYINGVITSAGTDNPWCPDSPKHKEFADGYQAAHEHHQVSIN